MSSLAGPLAHPPQFTNVFIYSTVYEALHNIGIVVSAPTECKRIWDSIVETRLQGIELEFRQQLELYLFSWGRHLLLQFTQIRWHQDQYVSLTLQAYSHTFSGQELERAIIGPRRVSFINFQQVKPQFHVPICLQLGIKVSRALLIDKIKITKRLREPA